jgi:DNA modification methylase
MLEQIQYFDFAQLNSPDFKEDSVREILILPLLFALGYQNNQIVRSKTLQHPFLKIGSKKRPINLIPDYLLKVEDSYAWVLDAKAPNENIKTGDNIEQVFSYSIHPEIRSKFFALCNGREFSLFRQDAKEPILYFELNDIEQYWEQLSGYLSPSSFQSGKKITYESVKKAPQSKTDFDYLSRPLLEEIPVKKQSAKRHFGVHGYFTKQSWNVVQEYIKNFSQQGDLILDPFGGSGVTAIEALMCDRRAIHIDLNPMSVFMVQGLVSIVNSNQLLETFKDIKKSYEKKCPETNDEIKEALSKYPYPKGLKLPKGSDVEFIENIFTSKQLAQLAFLKYLIKQKAKKSKPLLQSLMVSFSSSITRFNRTFHKTKVSEKNKGGGGGDSAAFRYYRYRIAPKPTELNLITIFERKVKNLVAAQKEIIEKTQFSQVMLNQDNSVGIKIIKGNAADLESINLSNPFGKKGIAKESVDYIYTDPPYGKKIPYLDLSVMWNAWLDLKVTEEDYALEAIEGGEHEKTKESYNELIAKSIQEMYRVLKFDRWMSFVFAHKDPEFWHLIIDTAEKCGFEYAGAVAQTNGHKSFKKRQNPFTVLSGQLIINFKKVRKPKYIMKAALGMEIGEIVMQTVEGIIAKNNGATLEQINDELIIRGLELGFLDLLQKEYKDLTPLLLEQFDFDDESELFTIKKNAKFKTRLDVKLRVKYYLISYLRRLELSKQYPTFDEIILHIMPLLKNGTTPENQTILSVLEDIAKQTGENCWKLKTAGQQILIE